MPDTQEVLDAKSRGGRNGKREDKKRAGRIGGKSASTDGIEGKVRAGNISNAMLRPRDMTFGGMWGCHVRWHVKRKIRNPDCKLCEDICWTPEQDMDDEAYDLFRKSRGPTKKHLRMLQRLRNRERYEANEETPDKPTEVTPQPKTPKPVEVSEEKLKAARELVGPPYRLAKIRTALSCTWDQAVAIRHALLKADTK